jgi:RNA polymerase primary sigma factor
MPTKKASSRKAKENQPQPDNPEEGLENFEEDMEEQSDNDLPDLLSNIDDPFPIEEPDQSILAREEPDLESLIKEEPLDLLDNPNLVMELSEDPVRLYLKEIGGIDLLDTDREFWLSTRLETATPHIDAHQPGPDSGAAKGDAGSGVRISTACFLR